MTVDAATATTLDLTSCSHWLEERSKEAEARKDYYHCAYWDSAYKF